MSLLTPREQMEALNGCIGQTIKRAERVLYLREKLKAHKILDLRLKLVGLKIGY